MKNLNNNHGFTLLEILIAITVMALLMLGVYSMVDNSATTQTRVVEEDDRLLTMETAMARLELDFTHLFSPLFYSVPFQNKAQDPGANSTVTYDPPQLSGLKTYRGTETFPAISKKGIPIPLIEQDDKDTISFLTSVHQRRMEDAKQANFAWVRYSLRNMELKVDEQHENVEANQELVRQYVADNPYDDNLDWDKIPEQVILKHIKRMEMKFYDKKNDKYVDNVKDLSGEIPRLMHLTLEWAEKGGALTVSQRYIRVQWPAFDTKADDQELMKAYYEIHKRNEENRKAKEGSGNETTEQETADE